MLKKKIMKYVMKYFVIVAIVLGFPWLFTLMFGGSSNNKIYESSDSGRYVIVGTKRIDVEDFVACALVKQMDIGDEEEALKAQAVIIRTYIYEKLQNLGKKEIDVGDLDLQYILFEELENIWGESFPDNYNRLMKIVSNTSGEILTYEDKVIKPYFHGVSCGYTRSGEDVLGEGYGYLMSVQSAKDVESEEYLEGTMIKKEDFAKKLRDADPEISISDENPLETMQIISRDTAGYVNSLQIGNVEMTGDEFAYIFQLNSPNFQVEEYEGQIRIITKGMGHGLGLSMYGAKELAKSGKSYQEILQHYYTGVYLTSLWEE